MTLDMSAERARQMIVLLKDVPHAYLYMIRDILTGEEGGRDWTKGVIRPVFTRTWVLFLIVHMIVAALGAVLSINMAVDIIRSRWYKTNTGKYLLNVAVTNILIAVVEVPMNFVIMLFENWVFGAAFCYLAALIPYLLVHLCMITFIMLIVDRYRYIAHPEKRQVHVVAALVCIWVMAAGAALPVLAYVHYRDIGHLDPRLRNNGLCWSTGDNYSRVVFATIFTLPALLIIILLTKTTSAMKTKTALNHLHQLQASRSGGDEAGERPADVNSLIGEDCKEQYKDSRWLKRQQCTQRYLCAMVVLWSLCWLPIKVFSVVNVNTLETDDNMDQIDLVHMIFLPVSALCAVTTPVCYKLMAQRLHRQSRLQPSPASSAGANDYQVVLSRASDSSDSLKPPRESFWY